MKEVEKVESWILNEVAMRLSGVDMPVLLAKILAKCIGVDLKQNDGVSEKFR